MDARPEAAAAEDDSPGRPSPLASPAPAGVTCEVLGEQALLTRAEADRLNQLTQAIAAWFTNSGALGEFRVSVVSDDRMARLHAEHKGEATTTDVLTFDLSDQESVLDTDIVVCADEARRQSLTRGHGLAEELALYIVHGILHCTGYDDHDEEGDFGADAMHAREDEILTAIGVGIVYASRSSNDPAEGPR